MPININQLILLFIISFFCSLSIAADIEKLADDDWIHLQSDNFDILTDLNEVKGRHLIRDLEAYRYFSIQMMGLKVLDNIKPLKIMAISSNANFKKLGLPENYAGVFGLSLFGYAAIANVNGYTADSNAASFGRQVLFHEYNHFLVRFTDETRKFPTWYDEGYAEYWGTFKFSEEKIFIGSASNIMYRAGDLFNRMGDLDINIEKLFKATKYPEGKEAIGRFYAQSFFVVHYFNSSVELRASLNKYINYLNLSYTEDQAFTKSFNMSYADLDKRVKRYVSNNLTMRVISTKEGALKFPEPQIKFAVVDKASFYRLTTEVLFNFSSFAKETMLPLLQQTSALNPQYATAKVSLLIRNYADDPKKIADELELQAPNDASYLTYKGNALQKNAQLQHAIGVENWQEPMKQARNFFRRAIKVDSALGAAYYGLGEAYTFLPASEALQEGAVGFETASLFDRDEATFSKLANLYIRLGRTKDALHALRNTVAFINDKTTTSTILILENLELLNSITEEKSEATTSGLTYNGGSIYSGAVVNNKPDGAGKITRPNGSYYEGNFTNGMMQGHGKIVTYNGFVYEGNFQNGIARGNAKITFPENFDIRSYEGENEYTFPHGKGLLTSKDGQYEGEFWYSLPQGQGTFTTRESKTKLQGKWIEGRYEWPGSDGIQFVGSINAAGQRNGRGVCKNLATKNIEWCNFKDGVQQKEDAESKNNK